MKFLIDENIPYAESFFAELGEIERFPGRELTSEQVKDADVLLVRSITKVNEQLLSRSDKLKFVGTATIGEDHIDKPLLAEKGISFSSAPGCNAVSVAEYVISALLLFAEQQGFELKNKTVAIVGVGNIGKRVEQRLKTLGCKLLLVDPVRARSENLPFVELEQALKEADIVTLHTPLTRDGDHPTFHLINEQNLSLLKSNLVLINACRGEVIDNQALYAHIKMRQESKLPPIKLVMDVWENEPNPMPELIEFCDIATAHIAGYSLEGKARGTEILYQKVCECFGLPVEKSLEAFLPKANVSQVKVTDVEQQSDLKSLVHLVYDVRRDDEIFRRLLDEKGFDWLRKNYPLRREWSSLQVEVEKKSSNYVDLAQLGFAI